MIITNRCHFLLKTVPSKLLIEAGHLFHPSQKKTKKKNWKWFFFECLNWHLIARPRFSETGSKTAQTVVLKHCESDTERTVVLFFLIWYLWADILSVTKLIFRYSSNISLQRVTSLLTRLQKPTRSFGCQLAVCVTSAWRLPFPLAKKTLYCELNCIDTSEKKSNCNAYIN